MSAASHTAGPWEWDGDPTDDTEKFRESAAPWLIDADENPVIKGDVVVTNKANASLIAAAPELLEALITLERLATFGTSSENALLEARSAILKATGRATA